MILQNWVNDLQFLTRILTFQRILLTKSKTKRCTKKSDPIFRCTTPSTGQIFGEVVAGEKEREREREEREREREREGGGGREGGRERWYGRDAKCQYERERVGESFRFSNLPFVCTYAYTILYYTILVHYGVPATTSPNICPVDGVVHRNIGLDFLYIFSSRFWLIKSFESIIFANPETKLRQLSTSTSTCTCSSLDEHTNE